VSTPTTYRRPNPARVDKWTIRCAAGCGCVAKHNGTWKAAERDAIDRCGFVLIGELLYCARCAKQRL
jgi:hypothetical protein